MSGAPARARRSIRSSALGRGPAPGYSPAVAGGGPLGRFDAIGRGAYWLSRAIYGTVLATAIVVAASEDDDITAGDLALTVATTALVFWLVHVYAALVGSRAERG